jgi:hypothetical protein
MTRETKPEEQPETTKQEKAWQRIGLIFLGAAVAGPLIGIWIGKHLLERRKNAQHREPETQTEPQRIEIPITQPAPIAGETTEGETPTPTPAYVAPAYVAPAYVAAAYVASDERDKYHREGCRWAQNIKAENLLTFPSREKAEAQGYRPCGTCRPDR